MVVGRLWGVLRVVVGFVGWFKSDCGVFVGGLWGGLEGLWGFCGVFVG